jgi:outer membrane protein OmpA-like peptidoglycan-associated protein
MRNWCVVLALSLPLAVPLAAQQRSDGSDTAAKSTAGAAEKSAAPVAKETTVAPTVRNVFALPAAPRPKGFPAAGASSTDEAPGRLLPRFELGGGYSYVNFNPGDPFDRFNSHGGTGSFVVNASRWFGLVAEIGSYNFNSRDISGAGGVFTTYLFGPRFNLRKFDYFVPFGEALIGGSSAGMALVGNQKQNSFASAIGGGVDMVIRKNFAWRVVQIDYLVTNFSGTALGGNDRQDSLRLGTGLYYRWGLPKAAPPPPVNHPPVASCSANPASVFQGSGDTVAVHVTASSPDNNPLSYSYTASGGTVEGTGPDARWNSAGAAVGSYTVTAKVDDGKGGTVSCAADIRVEEKPHHPPVISCAANPSSIVQGQQASIVSTASSPDNLPLTYSYNASGGQVTGSGAQAQFDSKGAQPGTYTVNCLVTDDRGDKADASTTVEVKEPPQVKQLEVKLALHSIYFPTNLPTKAKPDGGLLPSQQDTLTTLASDFKQYLTYKPGTKLILSGHADVRGTKEYNQALSERRVARTKSYLVEQGVPADSVETRALGEEENMTSEQVKKLIQEDPQLTPAERQKLIKNLLTVRLANNRRVDVTLSTTGEQSVRQFPFNAKDALSLMSRGAGTAKTAPKAGTKPPAPKKTP